MMNGSVGALEVLLVMIGVGVFAYRLWKASVVPPGLALPPGPKPLPILGSVLDVNRAFPWLTYEAWANEYGPIMYVRLLGTDVVIINSEEVAQTLFEGRSSVYSDRPQYVTNEFFGLGWSSGFLPYGEKWRFHRRLLHQTFRAASLPDTQPILLRKVRDLAKGILVSPDECLDRLRAHSASIMMAMIYGYETQPKNDRLLHVLERTLTFSVRAMTPEREAIASNFPFIKYIPTWLPGSQVRRDALQCRRFAREMLEAPFAYAVNVSASTPSMVADLLSRYEGHDNYDSVREDIKAAASTAFGAGSGTAEATFMVFLLAMVLNPDVQRRAQAEIDKVIDMDRLPNFDDRPSLPYVGALIREVMRWRPVTPLGIPHKTSQPDVYDGYYIPKGTMILSNIWAMSRSHKYPNPDKFIPERFLQQDGDTATPTLTEDDVRYSYGAGRRICAGRHCADAILWSTVVTLLACFEFGKVEGWEEEDVVWTSGIAAAPEPFPVKVIPRARAKLLSVD